MERNVRWNNVENSFLNILQNYTDQILREPEAPVPVPPINIGASRNRQTSPVDNEYELISDLIYQYSHNIREYNVNIREYNTNVRDIIYILENYQQSRRVQRNRATNFRGMYYQRQWAPRATSPSVLTREEIASATLTYGFTEEMILRDANGEITNVCPISLEALQIGDVVCEIRGCGHRFKRPNLMTWLNRNSSCPVCRYNLRTPLPTPSVQPPENDDDDDDDDEEEGNINDPSGNISGNGELSQQIQNSLTEIIQNLVQNSDINSFISDSSSNLLYEFQFPIFNTRPLNENINNDFHNEDLIHDENVD